MQKKLGRSRKSRGALFRLLIRALVEHGSITTTKAKAKAIAGDVDKLLSLVAKGDLAAKRMILAKLGNDDKTTRLLFEKYAAITKTRKSGFTKIVRLPARRGDAAKMVKLEFVEKTNENIPTKSKGN
ncbi:50S ribosomal protein L17 [Candidatus Woesebacteria bacterium RIFCSPHIGHO2_01_FULL_44_10]|uniref:50S ribosomal protein L17 n=1 Tax=Candidatus Woesebacteria bacterium RIFCSPLOWO2_01_FULL_44_14 TaxID=1802525 RepID=A0A1F8C1I5_9BACT|nr:MAG: 50S ribosomal protein L17 [Candidatus Woesebacteria bacterium RIFCSPHIGHO2_01_FULL_44_10]OGM54726.1 MAG: 50S ribosomal protein L17 [Candidatus Woesebacteria bacterium RIFCSPHIGHO2_12_FULL_44_11]OGM70196.1 MAG: 50S ribosomal protein L17 [Candidatus Woesebacteria bacterium RIFCSPLOWO2_01_FULL_44_14]